MLPLPPFQDYRQFLSEVAFVRHDEVFGLVLELERKNRECTARFDRQRDRTDGKCSKTCDTMAKRTQGQDARLRVGRGEDQLAHRGQIERMGRMKVSDN